MPAVPLSTTAISRNTANGHDLAAALTAGDSVNGHSFVNTGETLLRVKNTGGASVTVSVQYAASVDGATPAARTYVVPATTGDRLIGPLPVAMYGSTVNVGLSASAGVTLGVIEPVN